MQTDASPLIEAKVEYTNQLQDLVSRSIYSIFLNMFMDVVESTDFAEQVVPIFQDRLMEVAKWNSDQINEHTKKVIPTEDDGIFFSRLLTAVLILKTKIMTSFKIHSAEKNVQLKVPSNETFMHHLIKTTATHFFNDPFVFLSDSSKKLNTERYRESMSLIHDAVNESITFFVPVKDILKEYIGVQEPEPSVEKDLPQNVAPEETPAVSENETRIINPDGTIESKPGDSASVEAPESQHETTPMPLFPSPPNVPDEPRDVTKDVQEEDVFSDTGEEDAPAQEMVGMDTTPAQDALQQIPRRVQRGAVPPVETFDSDSDEDYEYEPAPQTSQVPPDYTQSPHASHV